ncbi:MAG: SgcJ/EcaC family oxidoreductase [Rhizobiales bacterium]|nr:SgcJ/EcaC family oxidoreductase [Hyphomicrobiales bacterium]OJX99309.1 MAG: DUF4440 domain-containing protein [Rhizobiales bacterium 63-22]
MKRYIALLIVPELFFMLPAAADAKGDRLSAPAASTVNCHVATKAQVARLFDRWNNSLHTGDPARVAANYTHDAVLLPTLSGRARHTQKEREEYFRDFLKKKPVGHIDSRTVRTGCNQAVDTGTYTFTFDDGSKVNARYTFTYVWDAGNWLISSHHSSVVPH